MRNLIVCSFLLGLFLQFFPNAVLCQNGPGDANFSSQEEQSSSIAETGYAKSAKAYYVNPGESLCITNPSPAPATFRKLTVRWSTTWTPVQPPDPRYVGMHYCLYDSDMQLRLTYDKFNWAVRRPPWSTRSDFWPDLVDMTPFHGKDFYFVFYVTAGVFGFNDSQLKIQYYSESNELIYDEYAKVLQETPTGIHRVSQAGFIEHPRLSQNYPNPFTSASRIEYSLPRQSFVRIQLYDLYGRLVSSLVDSYVNAGTYSCIIDGSKFATGTYIVRLETNNGIVHRTISFQK